jgi:hypothetical protein
MGGLSDIKVQRFKVFAGFLVLPFDVQNASG